MEQPSIIEQRQLPKAGGKLFLISLNPACQECTDMRKERAQSLFMWVAIGRMGIADARRLLAEQLPCGEDCPFL